jgi:hypothetical protein
MKHVSLWSLKKLPINDITAYIQTNSDPSLQARMVNLPLPDYSKLSPEESHESLITAISKMSEEKYEDFLLEIIDE